MQKIKKTVITHLGACNKQLNHKTPLGIVAILLAAIDFVYFRQNRIFEIPVITMERVQ